MVTRAFGNGSSFAPHRLVQQEASLRSPSPCTPLAVDLGEGDESRVVPTASLESLPGKTHTSLLDDAQEIIKFIAQR